VETRRTRIGLLQDLQDHQDPPDLSHVVPQLPEQEQQMPEEPPEVIRGTSVAQSRHPLEDPILIGSRPAQQLLNQQQEDEDEDEDDWEEIREANRERMINETEVPSPARSMASERSPDLDVKINRILRSHKRTWKNAIRHQQQGDLPQMFRILRRRRGELLINRAHLIRKERLLSEQMTLRILNQVQQLRLDRLRGIQRELEALDLRM
jgi:hypothetical protein